MSATPESQDRKGRPRRRRALGPCTSCLQAHSNVCLHLIFSSVWPKRIGLASRLRGFRIFGSRDGCDLDPSHQRRRRHRSRRRSTPSACFGSSWFIQTHEVRGRGTEHDGAHEPALKGTAPKSYLHTGLQLQTEQRGPTEPSALESQGNGFGALIVEATECTYVGISGSHPEPHSFLQAEART